MRLPLPVCEAVIRQRKLERGKGAKLLSADESIGAPDAPLEDEFRGHLPDARRRLYRGDLTERRAGE